MEYTRREVDVMKAEKDPEKLLVYIAELEGRLLKMYEVAHKFSLQTIGEGLPMPARQDDVLYKKEEAVNTVVFVRAWNCHFHETCLPDVYPHRKNVTFHNESGMDHVICFGCKRSVGRRSPAPQKGHSPSYVEDGE